MTTRERILSIRLADAIKKNPEYAERLQLRFVMKEPTKDADSDEACEQTAAENDRRDDLQMGRMICRMD